MSNLCPCSSMLPYENCCGLWHTNLSAPSALALMRSRYSAFVLELESYLLLTWHPSTRPTTIHFEKDIIWTQLTIKRHLQSDSKNAIVEFVAKYKIHLKNCRLHEISQFIFENEKWYYVKGRTPKL